MRGKYTIEEIREIFGNDGCILISTEYKGWSKQLEYIAQCGHLCKTSLQHFKNGGGRKCKKCTKEDVSARVRKPYEDIVKLFEEHGAKLLTPKNEYFGIKQSVEYQCSCGNTSHTSVYHWEHGHTRCTKCRPTGPDNSHWKHDKPDYMRIAKRQYPEYNLWRKEVFARDKCKCKCCGSKIRINAHHILNYSEYYDLQHEISNGITLCKECHDEFHKRYGRFHNNKEQIEEFLESHKARNDYQ